MAKRTTLVISLAMILAGLAGMAATWTYLQLSSPARLTAPSGVDAMFIEQMIPHHDDAIAMADLALTRAEHPEIRQLAADIKRTQTAENAQMREWYREWYETEVPDVAGASGMMGGMMGAGTGDLSDLEAAEPFDKAFIEQMVPHHQMAIMMSQMAARNSARPEMVGLTTSIIRSQSAEITKMQRWYDEWYGR